MVCVPAFYGHGFEQFDFSNLHRMHTKHRTSFAHEILHLFGPYIVIVLFARSQYIGFQIENLIFIYVLGRKLSCTTGFLPKTQFCETCSRDAS